MLKECMLHMIRSHWRLTSASQWVGLGELSLKSALI
jgi:hypothetical protein